MQCRIKGRAMLACLWLMAGAGAFQPSAFGSDGWFAETKMPAAAGTDRNEDSAASIDITGPFVLDAELAEPAAAPSFSEIGFGLVAMSGYTLLVAAPEQPGPGGVVSATNVYVRGANPGQWHRQAILPFTDSLPAGLAIDRDTIIVGVPNEEVGGHPYQGAAYIYVRSGSTWSFQAVLRVATGSENDLFGFAVAVSNDTAVIGAPGLNGDRGGAYVFVRSGATWNLQQLLAPPLSGANDFFGVSAAIEGDTVVVGAPYRYNGKGERTGAVFVFGRTGTTWSITGTAWASDGAGSDVFGSAVDLTAGRMLIGAPGKDGTHINQGAAYLFTSAGVQIARLDPPTIVGSGNFGNAVALDAATAVVAEPNQNTVYLFGRSGTAWPLRGTVRSTAADDSRLGAMVAVSGTLIAVGAPSAGLDDAGRAYVLADNDLIFAHGFEVE